MSIVDWQLVASDLERKLVHISAELVHRSAELTGAFHQLAASQAREQRLREELETIVAGWSCGNIRDSDSLRKLADLNRKLALHTDDTALQERLKEERERVAQMVLNGSFLHTEAPVAIWAREVAAAIGRMT